jgi:hypothetical protein
MRRTLPLALGLLSFAVIVFEILLTRIFSVVLLYHFAYVAVSLALVGFSIGALIVHYRPRLHGADRVHHTVVVYGTCFALAVVACAIFLIHYRPGDVDLYAGMDVPTFKYLLMTYAAATLPFILAGICVSAMLTAGKDSIGSLYAFDLLGAAAGALVVVPVLDMLGAPMGFLVASGAGCACAWVLGSQVKGALRMLPAAVFLGLVGLAVTSGSTSVLELKYSKGHDEKNVLYEKWNSFSRVTALPARDGVRLLIDSGAATKIHRAENHEKLTEEIFTPGLKLKGGGDILIIGPGGGKGMAAASELGFDSITGVELNPIIVDLATRKYRDMAGDLYDREGVEVVVDEGRSYLRHSDDRYDVLMLTNIDTWAATAAGAFTLAENHLYTVEAFDDYLEHLTDDGLVAITRWYFPDRPHESLRLMALAFAALENLGVEDPARHCVIIEENANRRHANFILKKSPFTDEELAHLRGIVEASPPWKYVFTPDGEADPVFRQFADAEDRQAFIADYHYNVSPPTDDQPFFFYVIRSSDLLDSFKRDFYQIPNVTNIGVFLLVSTFVLNALFMLLVFLLPAVFKRGRVRMDWTGVAPALGFFGCLGCGFMIVEMSLMQNFILFLGHPTHALTTVLFTVLLSSGLGSRYSGGVSVQQVASRLPVWIAVTVVYLLASTFFLPVLFEAAIGLAMPIRIALTFLVVAPAGFLMGTCFPSGIRMLGDRGEELLPWIWAVNGSMSVVGSSLAMLIAMNSGFQVTLMVGLAVYLIAFVLAFRISRPARAQAGAA